MPGLERAFYHLDAIADVEALVIGHHNDTLQGRPKARLYSIENLLASNNRRHNADELSEHFGASQYREWMTILGVTRQFQYKYIHSLPQAELYHLMALVLLAREGWRQWAQLRDWDNRLDIRDRRESAFMETLMRHGSAFLYGEVRGYGARALHCDHLQHLVAADLEGQLGPPRKSLWVALWEAARLHGWQLPRRDDHERGTLWTSSVGTQHLGW